MKFADLRNRVAVVNLRDEQYEYLATTPVFLTPGTVPYRIVLVVDVDSDKLVVWTQYFNQYSLSQSGTLSVSMPSFHSGRYFTSEQFHLAIKAFGETVAKEGEYHLESIYREVA